MAGVGMFGLVLLTLSTLSYLHGFPCYSAGTILAVQILAFMSGMEHVVSAECVSSKAKKDELL